MNATAFRPHHFLCTLCFQGKGYSPHFIANYKAIVAQLNAPDGDATPIEVVPKTDAICSACPHRQAEACAQEEKIQALDAAHLQTLKLTYGATLTWGEAKKVLKDTVSLEKFHHMCSGCNWKRLGICEKVLTEFLAVPTLTTV
jgi:hypothetical protein